jgi:hypothetical protein
MTNDDGWKPVSGQKTETWNQSVEKEIMGTYVDKQVGIGKYAKNIYVLELADGKRKGVWGSAQIDRALSNVSYGQEVRIIFTGKTVNPKTGGTTNNFEFFVRDPKIKPATEQPAKTEEGSSEDIPF